MATIRETPRKGGVGFQVRWREHGRERTLTFDDLPSAEHFQRFLEANNHSYAVAMDAYGRAHGTGPTVESILEDHIAGLTGVDARTRSDYRREARLHIVPTLGRIKVDQLTPNHIRAWVNDMGGSPKSISNRHGLLSAALTTAVSAGYISGNPCRGIRLPERETLVDDQFLTPDEYRALLACFPTQWKPIIRVLAGAGLRWGEAVALTVGDFVDGPTPYLRVTKAWKRDDKNRYRLGNPKTRRAVRDVTIDDSLAAVLRQLSDGRARGALLLPSPRGLPISYHYFQQKPWTKAVNQALPQLRSRPKIHHLRHSHGSWLLEAGVDMMTVSRRLGHESIQTTINIYGHVSQRSERASAEAIGRVLS